MKFDPEINFGSVLVMATLLVTMAYTVGVLRTQLSAIVEQGRQLVADFKSHVDEDGRRFSQLETAIDRLSQRQETLRQHTYDLASDQVRRSGVSGS